MRRRWIFSTLKCGGHFGDRVRNLKNLTVGRGAGISHIFTREKLYLALGLEKKFDSYYLRIWIAVHDFSS